LTARTLENNASVGGVTTAGAGNKQGPGGGEFYYQDNLPGDTTPSEHDYLAEGGVVQIPGYPDVAVITYNPIRFPELLNRGGIRTFNNTTGMMDTGYQIYNSDAQPGLTTFAKANGVGDLIALTNPAPIEIGNRVWLDANHDGIQDANEPGIAGVTVHLYAPDGTLLATAITDQNGDYYFSNGPGTSTSNAVYNIAGLVPNTTGYTVRLDNPADYTIGPLSGLVPTVPLAGTDRAVDSDGMPVSATDVSAPVNVGGPGQNNHTFDFGFFRIALPAIVTGTGPVRVVGSGLPVTDRALLSNGDNPTGTITFYLFAPGVTPLPDFSNNVYTDVVTVTGNGLYDNATMGNNPGGYAPTAVGTYQWIAVYSGDTNNESVTAAFGTEPDTVSHAGPAIDTTAGPTVVVGSGVPLTDTAALSGGFSPTGTITFALTDPGGTVVYTNVVPVNGNGEYTTAMGNNPGGFVPTAAGGYQWVATYSGDPSNEPVAAEFGNEPQVVGPVSPGIVTTPGPTVVVGSGVPLTDTALLSGGFSPTGTITFVLFAPGVTPLPDFSNNVYTDVVTVTGNGLYDNATMGNNPGGFVPTAPGTYQWVATYSSDRNNNLATTALGDEPNTTIPPQADMAVVKAVNDPTPYVGDTITYTITLSDNGPDTATNVVVTERLPAGESFVSARPSQGTYDPSTGLWSAGTVRVGSPETLVILARVVSPGSQADTATITHADQFDPVSTNNAFAVTVFATIFTSASFPSPTPTPCPTVGRIGRIGIHQQRTLLVVPFHGVVDPTAAGQADHYAVITGRGRTVPIVSASYDPATNTVTLRPKLRLNVHYRYHLEVTLPCPNGMTDHVVRVPFGTKSSLIGYHNHRGVFVPVHIGPQVLAGPYRAFPPRAALQAEHSRVGRAHSATTASMPAPHARASTARSERVGATAAGGAHARRGAAALDARGPGKGT
jgi:uncharacterized repeat protein (TIGR01451 family)